MKLLLTTLLWSCFLSARPQAVMLRGGHSLTPADYVSVGYEQPTNTSLNYSLHAFLENTHKNNLNYSAYGLDLLAVTQANPDKAFSLKAGMGATVLLENEPWVYSRVKASKRINYGIIGEAIGEWVLTNAFSLQLFAQQKYLFNAGLGRLRFAFGVGLSYHFSNF